MIIACTLYTISQWKVVFLYGGERHLADDISYVI